MSSGAIGGWSLLGALFGAGGLVLIWVAAHWDVVGSSAGGLAAGAIAAGLASHAAGIATRSAVVDPDAGRFARRRAERAAVRRDAPLAGAASFLGVLAIIGNLLWMLGYFSRS